MSVGYLIVCDGCLAVLSASARSASDARAVARSDAGGLTSLHGGGDLCANCAPQESETGDDR